MENLKERFNGENGIHDNYIKMLESLTETLPTAAKINQRAFDVIKSNI